MRSAISIIRLDAPCDDVLKEAQMIFIATGNAMRLEDETLDVDKDALRREALGL
jgi:hypothetical protein